MKIDLGALLVVIVAACVITRCSLNEECVEHGRNIGKVMKWNLYGRCEETKR